MDEQEMIRFLRSELYQAMERDPELRAALKHIDAGKGTFQDTAQYSERTSELLGQILSKHVDELPEGMREAVCKALLRERYEEVNGICAEVQEMLDEPLGIRLQPQRAPYPAERVQQVAHALEDPTVALSVIQRRAKAPVANVSKSFHDDYMKKNADVRSRLGFKCYLNRVAATGCCKWCTDIAGRYVYGDHPDEVFHRHDNCSCTTTFENGRERQDVWSKRTWQADPAEVEARANEPVRNSPEQAAEIEQRALSGLTLAGNGSIIRSIDVDDYATVTYGKEILPEVSDMILSTMKKCEKDGGFIISEISTTVVPTSLHGTPVLQIEPLANGLLQLNINADYLAGKTLAEVNAEFLASPNTVVNTLEEAVIHESGHAISIKGKTIQQIEQLYSKLKTAGLPGVSDIALADGAECLAELEVLRSRGARVSKNLSDFYEKYMGRSYS